MIMNYTTIARFRLHSLLLCKNASLVACSPSLIYTVNKANHSKRLYSLQTSVEGVITTQYGIFRTISESTPVEYLQNFIVNVHDTSGLPWWATVMCTTVLLRFMITGPAAIYQQMIVSRLLNINVELKSVAQELTKETAIAMQTLKWDARTADLQFRHSLKKQWTKLIIRDNCHPFKTAVLALVQIPLWVCVSVALRNLVYMLPKGDVKAQWIYSELSLEGFGWISNLTQADPLFITPVMLGVLNLAIIEIQMLSRVKEPGKFQRYLINFFRCFSVILVPIAASVPSVIALFWTTSSAYGLVQNLIMMSPKVKRFCRIPHTSLELKRPYNVIYNNFKQKMQLSRKV